MLPSYLTHKFLSTLGYIKYGSLCVVAPNGAQHHFGGQEPGPSCKWYIHDWKTVKHFASKGDVGLADAYAKGWWDSSNLSDLLTLGLMNADTLGQYIYGNKIANLASQCLYFLRKNSLKGSKRNIHRHYDLGNDFYSLWLDKTMSYSSGIFLSHNDNLEQAQHNKYQRIIDRFDKKSGRLLEIGCGWGGFANQAIQQGDFDIKGITLSDQQHHFANTLLQSKAHIALEDYRMQRGNYDYLVSIEMFEAVGEKYWPTYFNQIKSLLSQQGKALIQTITIDETHFERYRKTGDLIRTYVFPGGMLPSVTRFKEEAHDAGLQITDSHSFGQDYAKTLRYWLHMFDNNIDDIKALGFDNKFIRIWRLYLTTCIASFSVGRTNVLQLELQHA